MSEKEQSTETPTLRVDERPTKYLGAGDRDRFEVAISYIEGRRRPLYALVYGDSQTQAGERAVLTASAPTQAARIQELETKLQNERDKHLAEWEEVQRLLDINKSLTAQVGRLRGLLGETVSHIDGWHDLTTSAKRMVILDRGSALLERLRNALAETGKDGE